jgi:hypothetical protein
MYKPRGTAPRNPTHAKGSPEWLEFNKDKLAIAANTLNGLMNEAELFPVAQERLRKAFQFATNDGGMKTAVRIEWDAQNQGGVQ